MRRGAWVLVCALLIPFGAPAEEWRWEGIAAPGRYGDFPEFGRFAASNSFPIDSRVEVENIATGRRTTVFITRGLDEEGLLLLVSPDAARALGLADDGTTQVRIRRSRPIAQLTRPHGIEPALSDPVTDPLAARAAPEVAVEPEETPPRVRPEIIIEDPAIADEPVDELPDPIAELPLIPVPPDPEPEPDPELEPERSPMPPVLMTEPEVEIFEPDLRIVEEEPEIAEPPEPEPPVDDVIVEQPEVATRRVRPDAPPPVDEPAVIPEPDAPPPDEALPELPPADEVLPAEPDEPPEPVIVEEPPPVEDPAAAERLEPGGYYVQLGAFRSREGAGRLVAGIEPRYPTTVVATQTNGEPLYRVYLGPLAEDEAGAALYTARRRGYQDAFVTQP